MDPLNNHRIALSASQAPKTLGPVSDLERHLPADWWRTLFNAVYLKTDGDVVENGLNTVQDVDRLVEIAQLQKDDAFLDLCCGQGRHCLELAKRGYSRVTGLDRSRYLVRLARKRAQREGLSATFREGDARRFRLPEQSMACVGILGNSFGYFERAEDDLAVLQSVRRVLKPGGQVVLDLVNGDWMREHYEPRSWEWIDQQHFVCRERAVAKDGQRLISREVVTHAERGIIADQFYAERLYTYEQIQDLLRRAGFISIVKHEAPATASTRQQDLGMLTRRIMVVAKKPVQVEPRQHPKVRFRNVTVLMGDPQLPDIVKLNGQFNPEDLDTNAKMRDALKSLGDYEFAYFYDHEALLPSLLKEKPEFVFNLCDEGYKNDAFKELHVPALLEMFNIPYSGSGPSCLGLCYNKAHVRALAMSMDIAVPLESYFAPDDQMATLPSSFPALLKPNMGDSSQGITQNAVVSDKQELLAYWELLRTEFPNRSLLVQEFLQGSEYSVGIIGNPGMNVTVLPLLEVDYSGLDKGLPQILGYESKWMPGSPYWSQISYHEAKLSEGYKRRLIDSSMLLFERLGCRDYVRFDYRADSQGEIKLLEVNPNPGWCWDGKLNIMAGFAGYSYGDLLRMIIEAAQERYASPAGFRP
ncbi:MAG: methyltransferase domain-containing protein [Candidatus Hydrogenedentes bacterium]|nr:methyltransferase domain-containing protein [Candidatus Hydrogenedentota bacterium]